jgi:hypothetical protein
MKISTNMVLANAFAPKQNPHNPPKRSTWSSKHTNRNPSRVIVYTPEQIALMFN